MNKKLFIGILIFALFLISAVTLYNSLSENYIQEEPLEIEENEEKISAPDFVMYDKDGREVKLSSYKGKPIVMNFWATWCGPCRAELPAFQAMYDKYGEKLQFLMVNLTDGIEETKEKVEAFISKDKYSFPVFYDLSQKGAYYYSVSSVPLTVFIDKEGNIKNMRVGAMNEQMLSRYIDDLIGG